MLFTDRLAGRNSLHENNRNPNRLNIHHHLHKPSDPAIRMFVEVTPAFNIPLPRALIVGGHLGVLLSVEDRKVGSWLVARKLGPRPHSNTYTCSFAWCQRVPVKLFVRF
jgi:hypothetical protein